MNAETIFTIISFIFCSGVVYGSLNSRMKTIEKMVSDSKDIAERLAKIEERTQYLIDHIKGIK